MCLLMKFADEISRLLPSTNSPVAGAAPPHDYQYFPVLSVVISEMYKVHHS
jgi:hypothetical protein